MAKNSRYEIVGTEQPIKQSPPVASPSSDPRSGQFELIGDAVRMVHKSVQSPSADPTSGQFQVVGDSISMSRTAVKGWGNAAYLQMSDRAQEQSRTAGTSGGKTGRKRR